MRLKDRVAIVTGSGRGIGAATVQRLAEEGAKVTVTDVNAEACEATAAKIRAEGGDAIAIPCDITQRQAVEEMVQKTVDTFGRLD
ncbi:MAG: SDR family NAD(P)-dependent oxidoreductase, partial [Thermoactinomyces sp.]